MRQFIIIGLIGQILSGVCFGIVAGVLSGDTRMGLFVGLGTFFALLGLSSALSAAIYNAK